MKTLLILLASAGTLFAADWDALNRAAWEHSLKPVKPGPPFWNANARAFIHPPAFDAPTAPDATEYRYTLTSEKDGSQHTWLAESPKLPLTNCWDKVSVGYATLTIAPGNFKRRFYRAAWFCGPYPEGGDWKTAAQKCLVAVYSKPYVQAWLERDTPDAKAYDLYCYPTKILSSIIQALAENSALLPDKEKALTIAERMADWLISQSQKAGTPLEFLPPTYWGNARNEAVVWRGQNMLRYPPAAANAYLALADATGKAKWRDAAERIMRTMKKLQSPEGTWPLKVRESDGAALVQNQMFPTAKTIDMFMRFGERDVAEKAKAWVYAGPLKTWNWDGQFEDVQPAPPYSNLQKGDAAVCAAWLFADGRTSEGTELVDWCEDQFTVWSKPLTHMDSKNWKTPTALEQYSYYTPIDASMADMINAFVAAWKATGDELYFQKAKALADNLVRNQLPDGSIPTYFDSRPGSHWINCMIFAARSLLELDKMRK